MKIPFYRVVFEDDEIRAVENVLREGWIAQGPRVEEFERIFRNFVGAGHAIALNSCTAGLFLALKALKIGEGDEIITSPLTFPATANVIEHCGGIPVFIDVDENTGCINPEEIEKKITESTKAIIPVHLYGRPCEMKKILEIAKRYGLYIVEDAAHALGAEYEGKKIGSIGNITCFSFYATKNITTGDGGMLTTDDGEIAEKIKILRLHGLSRDAWKRYISDETLYYEVLEPGYKFNMNDLSASLGIVQLKKYEKIYERRKNLWKKYREILSEIEELKFIPDDGPIKHAYHIFPVLLLSKKISRNELREKLLREGISTSIHFVSLHLHKYYREKYGYRKGDFPNAEFFSERVISLPFYPSMSEEEMKYVCKKIKECLKG